MFTVDGKGKVTTIPDTALLKTQYAREAEQTELNPGENKVTSNVTLFYETF